MRKSSRNTIDSRSTEDQTSQLLRRAKTDAERNIIYEPRVPQFSSSAHPGRHWRAAAWTGSPKLPNSNGTRTSRMEPAVSKCG